MPYDYDNDGTPDSKIHGTNMGPTWVLSAPDAPHIGPVNLAIRDDYHFVKTARTKPASYSASIASL